MGPICMHYLLWKLQLIAFCIWRTQLHIANQSYIKIQTLGDRLSDVSPKEITIFNSDYSSKYIMADF
jgi:hypothetical protein